MPAVATLTSSASAQEAATATPAASPAASPVASPVAAVTVKMTSQLRFEPAEVTIQRGEKITWVNASPIPHTTTGDPAKNPVKETRPELAQLPPGAEGWDSGLLNEGQAFSHTFTVTGEYKYFCIPHVLSGMLGTITVQE
jgi:plastocyanin